MSFSDSSPQKIPKSKEKIEKFIKVPAGKEIQKEFFCLKENDLNLHFRNNNNNLKVQKKITFQKISRQGLQTLGPVIEEMAAAEKLYGHKNAVTVRLKMINQ